MTQWPVNWIEQGQAYKELNEKYLAYAARSQPVTVFSFTVPTQAMWEDAYVAQTGEIPPILPGSKLRWMDLKNGTIKAYSTVWMNGSNRTSIDPTVRPMLDSSQPWGAVRLLGKLGLYEQAESQSTGAYYPVTSDTFIVSVGVPQDITTMIDKGLVMMFMHFRSNQTAVYVDGSLVTVNYTVSRVSGTPTNTTSGPGQFSVGLLNSYHGYSMLFNTTTERIGASLSQLPGGMSAYSLGFNTAGIGTIRQTSVLDVSPPVRTDVRNISVIASPAGNGNANTAYLYGVFSSDPGYLESFENV